MTTKVCSKCREEKPLTPEFWYRDKYEPDGFTSNCKACRKSYSQQPEVKARNREYHKEWMRQYRQGDKWQAYTEEYHQRPEVKTRQRIYNQQPEVKKQLRLLNKSYMKTPRGSAARAACNANRQARKRKVEGHITMADVLALWEKYPVCLRCGQGQGLDHVVPMSKGGQNTLDNLQNLCKRCNLIKNNQTIDYRRSESNYAQSI